MYHHNEDLFRISIGSRGVLFLHRRSEPEVNTGVVADRGGFGEVPREIRDIEPADLGRVRAALESWGVNCRSTDAELFEQLRREADYGSLGAFFVPNLPEEMNSDGDVTTFESVAGLTTSELERNIGYERGRLSKGYHLYQLITPVGPNEFTWGHDTRYSGGFHDPREPVLFQGTAYRVMRADELRYALLTKHKGDTRAAYAEFDSMMEAERSKLNVRTGPKRIVKVFPVIRHYETDNWWEQYPDSGIAGTPQRTLRTVGSKLAFVKITYVAPRESLRVPL